MWCTTCSSNLVPSITERLCTLVGIVALPCRCRISKRKKYPTGDKDQPGKPENLRPCPSTSSLNLPLEGVLEEEHFIIPYFPSEHRLSFYIDTECEEINRPSGLVPMSSLHVVERPRENSVRNAVSLDDERSVKTSPLNSIPALTHDTRRAKYHMDELSTFADRLEQSASRAFPNRGRNRYKQVIAVLIQWGDDSSNLSPEIDRMRTIFEACYGFHTQLWLIPSTGSHLKLISLVLHFLEDHGTSDNLMIVYYGGHGVINSSGQTTWLLKQDSLVPSLDWSTIQKLFEETESDVLFLLDCCAVAGKTSGGGQGMTETIAASGVEPWPPGPGRNLFTDALISVLENWITRPSFTAAMLHSEVFSVIKHDKPEKRKWTDVQNIQDRKTPIYILNSSTSAAFSIELATRRTAQGRASSNFSRPALAPSPLNPAPVFTKYDIYNPSNLLQTSQTGELQIPHVLISVALEEDKLTDVEAWYQWVREIPALTKYAVVEGVYKSYSTMLLLSVPLPIWDMLPDDLAVSFVAYVQSRNLLPAKSLEEFDRPAHTTAGERGIERNRRQLHSSSKSHGGATEDHTNEPEETVKTTLETATLVKINHLSDIPTSPNTPRTFGFNRQSINSPVSPLSPVSPGTFAPRKTSMDRPSTSRGPDTKRYSKRLDSPRVSSDFAPDGGINERPLPSKPSGSDRVFSSLQSPLHNTPPMTGDSGNERSQTSSRPGIHRPPGRYDNPLHSNPFQANLRIKTPLNTTRNVSRQSTDSDNRDPSASKRYVKDKQNTTETRRLEQPEKHAQESVQVPPLQTQNKLTEQQPDINPQTSKRLERISSRRAAKLDAALSDIFAVDSPDPQSPKQVIKRRSAAIDAVSELEITISATEALISDLQAEAVFAREEARRAWDELGKCEREERERLASLRDGKNIWIGSYQLRVVNKTPDLGSKAAAFLGTILSPREAMEKHRRSKSEPRYSGKRSMDSRIKIRYPPIPPPKNTPPIRQFATHPPFTHISQLKAPTKPVNVYRPKLPEPKVLLDKENKTEPGPSKPNRKSSKRPVPDRKSSRHHVTNPRPHPPISKTSTTTAFAKPDFGSDNDFPDADPNVMRHMTSFEDGHLSWEKRHPYDSSIPPDRKAGGGGGEKGRMRGRSEAAYTFFHDEDLLDREFKDRGRRMEPIAIGEVRPKRKGSKLVKKRLLVNGVKDKDKAKGKEREGSFDTESSAAYGSMENRFRVRV